MFESESWQRLSGTQSTKVIGVHLGYVPDLTENRPEEKSLLRRAAWLAVGAHLAFFAWQFPAAKAKQYEIGTQGPVTVVRQVRFEPPPPAKAQKEIPKPKTKRIPIPDPTPDDPEPIVLEEIEVPVTLPTADTESFFGIPDAPPGAGFDSSGAVRLSGDITPPVKTYYPTPKYTEDGRLARVQGVVILEAIVDTLGNVSGVKVLKGLPHGLDVSAVETAQQWKFKPALRAGRPVAVILNLTIRFSLQ